MKLAEEKGRPRDGLAGFAFQRNGFEELGGIVSADFDLGDGDGEIRQGEILARLVTGAELVD